MIRIAIIGSREFPELNKVEGYLDSLNNFEIITGGARGVDDIAEQWAKKNNVKCEVIRPVNPTQKFSYLLRNVEIITKADKVVAFWDGKSKGTKFVIDYCYARQKELILIQ